ncbi:uncharacterized protein LOC117104164 [Anneissia japonica]|uniref:uncharacterized protein LOC117104164 n=1 Tax=Anneissia japonica TaxID=1529436 RepID=UPI0014257724|nr:uncharacterized protein LOC117104164 [Anneissia japonica]
MAKNSALPDELENDNTNDACVTINNVLKCTLNKRASLFKIPQRARCTQSWMNSDILAACRARRKAEGTYRKSQSTDAANIFAEFFVSKINSIRLDLDSLALNNDDINDTGYLNVSSDSVDYHASAFDTIDHALLLNTLKESFGISDKALHLLYSYLDSRSFRVNVGSEFSNTFPLKYGVPQGNMTAFSESVWSPDKGRNNGRDMQWGGGTLFVDKKELADTKSGGRRKLSERKAIPVVDLSRWIKENTRKEDYVILKLDVEGAEYKILKKMLEEGTFAWIDKYYGEYHSNQPVGLSSDEKGKIINNVMTKGEKMYDWGAERRNYADFEALHPTKIPEEAPGKAGAVYSKYNIGLRGNHPYPTGHFEMMAANWIREAVVSSEMRLRELDINPIFYSPNGYGENLQQQLKHRGFRIIKAAVNFPPKSEPLLTVQNYYKFRDVERVPKALRAISNRLQTADGGILSLDTDLPDTYMNFVFLLDYLVEKSGYTLVSLNECVR